MYYPSHNEGEAALKALVLAIVIFAAYNISN